MTTPRQRRRYRRAAAILASSLAAHAAAGLAAPTINGDWSGELAPPVGLKIVVHIEPDNVYLVSPDQSLAHLPAVLQRDGHAIDIDAPLQDIHITLRPDADDQTLVGRFEQNENRLALQLTRTVAPNRPQRPRPPYPYLSREVTFAGGTPGVTLAGRFTRPRNEKDVPAAVLIAGSGPMDRNATISGHKPFLLLANRLTKAGFAVLRYDKRCVAASTCRRTAFGRNATGPDLAADARGALAWLRQQPHVQTHRIGLIGHSEGGEIAPMIARDDKRIAFVVLLGAPGVPGTAFIPEQTRRIETARGVPADRLERVLAAQHARIAAVANAPSPIAARRALAAVLARQQITGARADRIVDVLTQPMYRWLLRHDPAPALAALTQPVLVVAGGKDLQVPPGQNLAPVRRALADNRGATIIERPGLNHLLQPARTGLPSEYARIETTIDPDTLARIVQWATTHAAQARADDNARPPACRH